MKRVALKPIYDNKRFKESIGSVRIIIIDLFYYWSQNDYCEMPMDNSLKRYISTTDKTWYKYNKEIIDIFQEIKEVMLKKRAWNRRQTEKATIVHTENALQRKYARLSGTLSEEILDNPAPIMPQKSAVSAQIHRNRIINEQQYKLQSRPVNTQAKNRPMLTETPKG